MIAKKNEWDRSKTEWGFGRVKIDNFLDEQTVHQLYEECKNVQKVVGQYLLVLVQEWKSSMI